MKSSTHILSVLGAAAVLACMSVPAMAQVRGNFNAYDRDNNGAITQQEFEQMRSQRPGAGRNALSFEQMDSDHNGTINRSEFNNAHENRLRPGERRGATLGQGQDQGRGRGAAADAPRPQPGVGQGRRMGPGMAGGQGRGSQRPGFADMDKNRDGSISPTEMNQFHQERRKQRAAEGRRLRNDDRRVFDSMDTNRDGKVDQDEFSGHQNQGGRGRNR